jgi:hypothetical protein
VPELQFLDKNSKFRVQGRTVKSFRFLARAVARDPVTGLDTVLAQVESEPFKVRPGGRPQRQSWLVWMEGGQLGREGHPSCVSFTCRDAQTAGGGAGCTAGPGAHLVSIAGGYGLTANAACFPCNGCAYGLRHGPHSRSSWGVLMLSRKGLGAGRQLNDLWLLYPWCGTSLR